VSDAIRDEASLSAELAGLRAALREVRAPADEPALRQAAQARTAARERGAARQTILVAARARSARARLPLGLAAAAAVAAVAVLLVLRVERRPEPVGTSSRAAVPVAASPVTGAPASGSAFRPIAFARRLSAAESYSVVRVRIRLATFASGSAAADAAIEADLLIGEDGLARAIRFDGADTLPVYAAPKIASGERR
jgi:hypothetical protein